MGSQKPEAQPTDTVPNVDIFDLPDRETLVTLHAKRFHVYVTKGKTPSEAAAMLQNRASTVRQFMMQNFELIEKRDKDMMQKATRHFARLNIVALIGAFIANIVLNPITRGRIFDWPAMAKIGLRSSLFAAPLGYTMYHSYNYYTRLSLYLEDKYGDRIAKFLRSGDPSTVNPEFVDPYQDYQKKSRK